MHYSRNKLILNISATLLLTCTSASASASWFGSDNSLVNIIGPEVQVVSTKSTWYSNDTAKEKSDTIRRERERIYAFYAL